MTGEPDEDLLDVGADRSPRFDAWSRWWRTHRVVRVVLVVVVVGLLAAVVVGQNGNDTRRRTAPVPTAPSTPSGTSTPFPDGAEPRESDEYLVAVPAQDLRAGLARCGRDCVATSLDGSALVRAVRTFAGMRPLAGGTLTRRGRLVLQTIEGYAAEYAIVHLTVRVARGVRPSAPTVATDAGAGYATTTVTAVRNGCRFTAELVARASVPSPLTAERWAATTPLRCG